MSLQTVCTIGSRLSSRRPYSQYCPTPSDQGSSKPPGLQEDRATNGGRARVLSTLQIHRILFFFDPLST